MERLQRIPGVKLPEPEGAFYALPDMTSFFGHGVEADEFGSIPDVDTLCRQVHAARADKPVHILSLPLKLVLRPLSLQRQAYKYVHMSCCFVCCSVHLQCNALHQLPAHGL